MQKWNVLVLPLLLWGVAVPVAAEDSRGGSISFVAAREIILSQNAGLKSANTETEAAMEGVSQAGVLPNPGVGIALDKFGANEIEASIEQTIELGGKRRLRTEAAQKGVDLAKNTHKFTQLELEAEIVRRFVPITTATGKLLLIDSIIAITQATREQIQNRVTAGAAKKTDLIRAEIDIEQLTLERNELVRENDQARKKFAALSSTQDTLLLKVSGSASEEAQIPSLDALCNALTSNPELRAVDIEQERLATEQKQLRAEVVPDLNLSAGYRITRADNSHAPLVGLSMNVPLFNNNSAAQKQIEFKRQAANQRRENRLRLLDADVNDLQSRILEIDTKIAMLTTSAIPKAMQVYTLMKDYYSAGSVGFLDLSATQTDMLNLRMTLLDIRAERAQKLADLMQITSLNIPIVK